jgi:hypothetical protein
LKIENFMAGATIVLGDFEPFVAGKVSRRPPRILRFGAIRYIVTRIVFDRERFPMVEGDA